MADEIIRDFVNNAVESSKWKDNKETTEAYREGAYMLLDFLQHNPVLLMSKDAAEFRELIYPSKLNLDKWN